MIDTMTQMKVDIGLILVFAGMQLSPSNPETLQLLDWEIENAELYVTDREKWIAQLTAIPTERAVQTLKFDAGVTELMTKLDLDITEGVEAMKAFRAWFVNEYLAGKSLHPVAAQA